MRNSQGSFSPAGATSTGVGAVAHDVGHGNPESLGDGAVALFDGWLAGALQVAEHLDPTGLNRVLLLSDGQANEGLTDAAVIAEKASGLNQRGISTSAFGLGAGFDEDLMGAIPPPVTAPWPRSRARLSWLIVGAGSTAH